MKNLVFIDVEASGLEPQSYPIQIGWLDTDGINDEFFINPLSASDWVFWDDYAEFNVHKISRETCINHGLSIYEAAERLNNLLRGLLVLSDAVDYDANWILKLMNASGCEPSFEIIDIRDYLNSEQMNPNQFKNERKARTSEHRALLDCARNIHAGAACGFWEVSENFTNQFGKVEIHFKPEVAL